MVAPIILIVKGRLPKNTKNPAFVRGNVLAPVYYSIEKTKALTSSRGHANLQLTKQGKPATTEVQTEVQCNGWISTWFHFN